MARRKVVGVQPGTGKLVKENTPKQQAKIAKKLNKNNASNKRR